MSRFTVVADNSKPLMTDPAFAIECRLALEKMLEENRIITMVFLGESPEHDHIDSVPPSVNAQWGAVMRARRAQVTAEPGGDE